MHNILSFIGVWLVSWHLWSQDRAVSSRDALWCYAKDSWHGACFVSWCWRLTYHMSIKTPKTWGYLASRPWVSGIAKHLPWENWRLRSPTSGYEYQYGWIQSILDIGISRKWAFFTECSPQVYSFGDFDTRDNGKMPLALSLSPHPDLYRNGSEWAVGNSNFAKLIHFLKNAQFFMLFFFRILCMFYSIRLRADTKLMLISGLCKSEVGSNRFRDVIFFAFLFLLTAFARQSPSSEKD